MSRHFVASRGASRRRPLRRPLSVGAGHGRPGGVGLVFCHTADWHLGRTLHGASFEAAHRRFLAWLVEVIARRGVDVLLVAGDVFDRSVPTAAAEALFYGFLSELAQAAPGVQVIVVAGNHDGPARLAAPAPMLARLGAAAKLPVRIVSSVPILEDGTIDAASLIVPLRTRGGEERGRLIAVPFLRPSDLSRVEAAAAASGAAIARARVIHERLVVAASEAAPSSIPGSLLLATGHGHVRGARVSPDSERPLLGGDDAALPLEVFPRALDYVALGHLHLAQALDGGRIRYSGAPLPLAFSERDHPHQVVIGSEREGSRGVVVDAVRVPRFVELVRIEGQGGTPLELADATAALRAMRDDEGTHERWVQVRVRLPVPRPALRRELSEALASAPGARLVSVEIVREVEGMPLPRPTSVREELAPDVVLARAWSSVSRGPVPEALGHALHEAWREAQETREAELAEEPELDGSPQGRSVLEVAS